MKKAPAGWGRRDLRGVLRAGGGPGRRSVNRFYGSVPDVLKGSELMAVFVRDRGVAEEVLEPPGVHPRLARA